MEFMESPSEMHIEILERPIITCSDLEEMLGDYVEGDLLPTLHARLVTHIEDCEVCQKLESDYRLIIQLAFTLRDRPVPQDVKARLRNSLSQKLGINLPQF